VRVGPSVVVEVGDDLAARGLPQAHVARVAAGPGSGVEISRTPYSRAISGVASVEPSSTTITS
jgi:hypothetical protein